MIKVNKNYEEIPELLISESTEKKIRQALKQGKIVEFSKDFLKKIKPIVAEIYHNKCAYCETSLEDSAFAHVTHYRPKSTYYWLGYEWSNIIFICEACNASKANQFPIQGKPVVRPQDNRSEWRADSPSFLGEQPLLLHPELDDPADHLIFLPDGTIIEKNNSVKGRETLRICALNREPLVSGRKFVIEKIRHHLMEKLVKYYQLLTQGKGQTETEMLELLFTTFEPDFVALMSFAKPENPFSRLWWFMVNNFKQFFSFDPPGDKFIEVLSLAFDEFKRRKAHPSADPLIKENNAEIEKISATAELSITINKLKVKNFKCFEDKEFIFSDRFNLLIGDNGTGKTAVLEAMSTICSSLLIGFKVAGRVTDIKDENVRRVSRSYEKETRMESIYPTSVFAEALVMGKPMQWGKTCLEKDKTISEDSQLTPITSQFYQAAVVGGLHVTLPVIAYYGTGRLWIQIQEKDIEPLSRDSRMDGYNDCLDPRSDVKGLISWFKTKEMVQIQHNINLESYEIVKKAIMDCIEEYESIRFDFHEDSIMAKIKDGTELPNSLMSDGYRNIMLLVADIAFRMSILNPHLGLETTQKTPGIVLIDEIDLHLHPKWQKRVIEDLMRTFPLVQFIATTHSPFIAQSLTTKMSLINLDIPTQEPQNMDISIEDIAEDIMGVEMPQKSKRYQDMMEVAEKYYKLLEEGKSAKTDPGLKKIKDQLDVLLIPYSDDPAFLAFLKMERTAAGIDETN